MKQSVPHDLGLDAASKATKAAIDAYSKRFAEYSPWVEWSSETAAKLGFTAKGLSLKGALSVAEKEIVIELDVPFLLKPFSGKAMSVVKEEITEWIEKAKQEQI